MSGTVIGASKPKNNPVTVASAAIKAVFSAIIQISVFLLMDFKGL